MRPILDTERLCGRLRTLGELGRNKDGRLTRLAGSDADRLGRDQLVAWMREAGLDVRVDRIGNVFGLWSPPHVEDERPVMIGSHIDTVINAGIYDGCYGVLAGLEVLSALRSGGFEAIRPLCVAAFSNEEGVRFTPDMMGSLVHAGGLYAETALAATDAEGFSLGEELRRIGYAGDETPGFLKPCAYLELHIEQGPVLEREGLRIGAVENLQGISWRRVTFEGLANHAGATPMAMRADAGLAAAEIVVELNKLVLASGGASVGTVGCFRLEPDAINVIPSSATFTIDLRDPDEGRLQALDIALERRLVETSERHGVRLIVERLARFEPVTFDARLVELIEAAASRRGLSHRRMTSGAGHDAQMIARIAPAAMIFVPSVGGVSHNPREFTHAEDLEAGALALLDVVAELARGTP